MSEREQKAGTPLTPPGGPIQGTPKREDFTEERSAFYMDFLKERGQPYLTPEQRQVSMQKAIRHLTKDEGVWVFGYGSLMWNPAFFHDHCETAVIHGYHRRFCMGLELARASAECPGLMLALDNGGSCKGMGFYIPPHQIEEELTILWRREMVSGAYHPRWVNGKINGTEEKLLTFVINHDHPRYKGHLPLDEQAAMIAKAEGHIGTNREYLYNMVGELDGIGIRDGAMHKLMELVIEKSGDNPEVIFQKKP